MELWAEVSCKFCNYQNQSKYEKVIDMGVARARIVCGVAWLLLAYEQHGAMTLTLTYRNPASANTEPDLHKKACPTDMS